MATGTCEVLERDLESPEAIEELPVLVERILRLSKEDKRKVAEVPQSEEEVNSSSHGIEKEERNTLHVIEKDLDEFVESITDTPVVTEKTVTRVERVEEIASSASPQVPKTLPVKRKAEPRTISPMKEEVPWEGLTLNKCILIASFVALLCMGFQVFQDVIDVEDEIPEAEPSLWAQPACSLPEDGAGERGQLRFFKSWLSWWEPEAAEDPEAKVEGTQQDSPARAVPRRGQQKRSALEKEVEKPRESEVAQPERGSKKGMQPKDRPPKGQASKMHRAPPAGSEEEEEEEEGQQHSRKEGKRREGKEQGERTRRDKGKGRHPKPDSPAQGPGHKEHRHDESGKQNSKQQRGEHKGRKPWEQHKFREGKRHD
ncbi:junctional sarcoplasmic reticulum protein 1 isoform X2 [Gopherus flavomarginatus]|nr:junctional sarcoplasmic reticulum protein 1 isoform X2 [Gopherus flavomarginatus]XP_050790318.1 junctional sarcoplasmic reticulum protein 1 isoform X2 [Gopherus flavomarginatus]XP_050790319.1 junctional sarcoplasmic reticulum protein 1 isoform X2 [Gopherus flavomarginatus]XP_050790320.1 junctional sarcoplasmic reticulum protein 1 isoform X2 [Gopherus flavomarginatus]